MKLTGKCKEAFLKWHKENYQYVNQSNFNSSEDFERYLKCNDILIDALIIEFFDSVGLMIGIYPNMYNQYIWHVNKKDTYKQWRYKETCLNRQEATHEAILEANEIFNENN